MNRHEILRLFKLYKQVVRWKDYLDNLKIYPIHHTSTFSTTCNLRINFYLNFKKLEKDKDTPEVRWIRQWEGHINSIYSGHDNFTAPNLYVYYLKACTIANFINSQMEKRIVWVYVREPNSYGFLTPIRDSDVRLGTEENQPAIEIPKEWKINEYVDYKKTEAEYQAKMYFKELTYEAHLYRKEALDVLETLTKTARTKKGRDLFAAMFAGIPLSEKEQEQMQPVADALLYLKGIRRHTKPGFKVLNIDDNNKH